MNNPIVRILKLMDGDQEMSNSPEIKMIAQKWGLSVGDLVCTKNGLGKVTSLERKATFIRVDNEITFRKELM